MNCEKTRGSFGFVFLSTSLVSRWPLFRIPSLPLSSNNDTCNDLKKNIIKSTYIFEKCEVHLYCFPDIISTVIQLLILSLNLKLLLLILKATLEMHLACVCIYIKSALGVA